MILRLSQKLSTKIKARRLIEMPVDENLLADWSCHIFNVGRTQHFIVSNTPSMYSCLLHGRAITSESTLIQGALHTIREFMGDDGRLSVFERLIAPASSDVKFAKALNRSVTGSMNDHIQGAKIYIAEGIGLHEVGVRLNKTPLSALVGRDGKRYANPKAVFELLADRANTGEGLPRSKPG